MVDENLKSLELFKEITDPSLEELAPYLLRLLHQIVVLCFYKHRTRANSEDVRFLSHGRDILMQLTHFIPDYATVVNHQLLMDPNSYLNKPFVTRVSLPWTLVYSCPILNFTSYCVC